MKLYEIDRSIQEILDNMSVDAETGEVTLDEEGLAALQLAREQKLEGVALCIKNLSAEAEAIRNEEKALADSYDYYRVPSVFFEGDKLYECSPRHGYGAIKAHLRAAFDQALAS